MDLNQEVLVELLSLSLQGKKAPFNLAESAEWTSILRMAQDHSILPIIYTALNPNQLSGEIREAFNANVFSIILLQMQNLTILEQVIDKFIEANIPLIAMKGLVLRNLYPYPETRTMSDFDLEVKEENFGEAIKILQKLGFRKEGTESIVDIKMIYNNQLILELHKRPFDESRICLSSSQAKEMWENAISISICGRNVLSYSDIDTLLYLLLHIQKHFKEGGFGLRQLCDIVLFVRAKWDLIDWEEFCRKIDELFISRFTIIIFIICNQLFGMAIPNHLEKREKPDSELINSVIQDIFNGGIFGDNTAIGNASSQISHTIGFAGYGGVMKFVGIIKFLFPLPSKLYDRYVYVKKYPWLLPIAWIHRWFYNIWNKQQRELLEVLLHRDSTKKMLTIMERRSKLINQIDYEERQIHKINKKYI